MSGSFGARLRWWRAHRGLSQLDLAGAAGTTQRHLSFLESGRAQPSREMVLRLAATLEVPLRQQNALLLAAGLAPAWRESDLAAPELEAVNQALDHMLAQQEPFPAIVVDRRWNILRANASATRLMTFLTGPAPDPAATDSVNIAEWLLSPAGLRPFLVNWQEVDLYFLRGVQADASADGTQETAEFLRRLLAYPGVPALSHVPALEELPAPVLAMHFHKGQTSLHLFTTIATLGTPHDVTVQELRIAGAALDVWYQYPTGPGPTFSARQAFQELPNVLMTPHVSGWTEGMLEARARLIAENIRRAAHGEPPVHLISAAE